jgi:hypothetical protein
LPELSEKTLVAVFQDKVNVFSVMEKTVKFQDVWMVHVHLELDLLQNLVFHFGLFNFGLVHNFDRIDKSSLFLLRNVNIPKATTSELFAEFKLINFDFLKI